MEKILENVTSRIRNQDFRVVYQPEDFNEGLVNYTAIGEMNNIDAGEYIYIVNGGNIYEKEDESVSGKYYSIYTTIDSEVEEMKSLLPFNHKSLNINLKNARRSDYRKADSVNFASYIVFVNGLDGFKNSYQVNRSLKNALHNTLGTWHKNGAFLNHSVVVMDTSHDVWKAYVIQEREDIENIINNF